MFQNLQRLHHRQGKQALGDTAPREGNEADHCRGEGQEDAREAVDNGRFTSYMYNTSVPLIKLSVNQQTSVAFRCAEPI